MSASRWTASPQTRTGDARRTSWPGAAWVRTSLGRGGHADGSHRQGATQKICGRCRTGGPTDAKPPPTCGVPQVGGGLKWWRWRESNPRPSTPRQGFSGRSLLCFSQPRRSRRRVADGLSHCLVSRSSPWPGQSVEPSSDARSQAEGTPGLTEVTLLRQRGPGSPGPPQRACYWHLLFCGHRINEVMSAVLGPLHLTCKVEVEASHPLCSYQHVPRRARAT